MRGLVVRSQSGFFTVKNADNDTEYVCRLRGKLLKGRRVGDVVAIGDWVVITPTQGESGMIDAVEPRKTLFSRLAPNPSGFYQQILIANPDEIVLVFACQEPEPHLGMLDRFLVIAEKNKVPAVIVANKLDLVGMEQAQKIFSHYPKLGYPVIYTSTRSGLGVEHFRHQLTGKISLLTGPSGVGKSSLLNVIQPELGLRIKQVSQSTSKGRHSTVVRELFELPCGGFVADTPGLKALALWDVEPEELDGYFPEIRERVSQCQFNDCTHVHEPGCAVLAAVDSGAVHPLRYRSYLNMRQV